MRHLFKVRRPLSQKGVSLVEYTLILSFVVFGCIGTIVGMGIDLSCIYFSITGQADVAFQGALGSTGNSVFDLNGDGVVNQLDVEIYRTRGCRGPF